MARTNPAPVRNTERTYEGGQARTPAPAHQLQRQVAACMLYEDTFYSKGSQIADEIAATCLRTPVEVIAQTAIQAREDFKLRHAPLFLLAQLDLRRKEAPGLLATTVERVIQRPDELAELLAIIQKVNGAAPCPFCKAKFGRAISTCEDCKGSGTLAAKPLKKLISAQVKKGLARAFRKFGFYALSKWNRDSAIKLRDVLFLVHAKPKDAEQAALWKKLVDGTLEAPDTWEVALSAGADKRETWTRLLTEEKLGYIALLMNVRNMAQAKVDTGVVERALLKGAKDSKALPFRFVSAYKAEPSFAQALSDAMLAAIDRTEQLPGTTFLVIDVSGSMDCPVTSKSQLQRWEAAAALGVLAREVCQTARVFTFSQSLVEVPNLRGLPLISAVARSQPFSGTYLKAALQTLWSKVGHPDRVIVVTDEQTHDGIAALPAPTKGYLVNVAAERPALALDGKWHRISGFSERLVDWIRYEETASRL